MLVIEKKRAKATNETEHNIENSLYGAEFSSINEELKNVLIILNIEFDNNNNYQLAEAISSLSNNIRQLYEYDYNRDTYTLTIDNTNQQVTRYVTISNNSTINKLIVYTKDTNVTNLVKVSTIGNYENGSIYYIKQEYSKSITIRYFNIKGLEELKVYNRKDLTTLADSLAFNESIVYDSEDNCCYIIPATQRLDSSHSSSGFILDTYQLILNIETNEYECSKILPTTSSGSLMLLYRYKAGDPNLTNQITIKDSTNNTFIGNIINFNRFDLTQKGFYALVDYNSQEKSYNISIINAL